MAGDWIKIEHVTPDKPEVHAISERLCIDPDAAFGKLCRIWIWADQQIRFCNGTRVTKSVIDRIAYVSGFAQAMLDAGWLRETNGSIEIPNFDHHNSQTAKERALTYKRVQRNRKRKCNAPSVTESLPETETEIDITNKPSIKSPFLKPTIEELRAYCKERSNSIDAQAFLDHYESNGWKVGKNPMKDWKATVRKWEQNQQKGLFTNGRSTSNRVGPGQRFQD